MPREALGAGLHVKLCGQFSVSLNGHDVVIPSRKAKALFAILVLEHPKPQSRDSLCGLLWPNVDLSNARSSLRQSLNILRGAFPKDLSNPITTPNNQISLAQISLNCDLDILLETQDLDAAILLSDCIPNLFDDIGYFSEDFEEWAQHKRTRYMAVLRTMLRQVYESPDESSEKRISFAETALRNDELDENAVRALMRCYAQTNNSAAALRVYNAYFKMLERELDAEPSGATQDLAVEIKLAQKPPSSGSPVAAAPLSKDVTIAVMPLS
jgi:DNA-binding SARP family transcriptional activator